MIFLNPLGLLIPILKKLNYGGKSLFFKKLLKNSCFFITVLGFNV